MVPERRGRAVSAESSRPGRGEEPSAERLLMRLAPGERFYKFYILTEPGAQPSRRVEHRIISKEHADGSLEMVSYNAWLTDGHAEKRDVIRVPALSKASFDQLVARVRDRSDLPPDSVREIDLSRCDTVEDQLRLLGRLAL